jgi:hypothetical protein
MWQLLGIAATFTWLGMVLAISFLETPLKFQAPGITLPLGLGIGRIVFRGLNIAEVALAVIVAVATFVGHEDVTSSVLVVAVAALLLVQLSVLRPGLDRRTRQIIDGRTVSSSWLHLAYIALECVKVAALIALGVALHAMP